MKCRCESIIYVFLPELRWRNEGSQSTLLHILGQDKISTIATRRLNWKYSLPPVEVHKLHLTENICL